MRSDSINAPSRINIIIVLNLICSLLLLCQLSMSNVMEKFATPRLAYKQHLTWDFVGLLDNIRDGVYNGPKEITAKNVTGFTLTISWILYFLVKNMNIHFIENLTKTKK